MNRIPRLQQPLSTINDFDPRSPRPTEIPSEPHRIPDALPQPAERSVPREDLLNHLNVYDRFDGPRSHLLHERSRGLLMRMFAASRVHKHVRVHQRHGASSLAFGTDSRFILRTSATGN